MKTLHPQYLEDLGVQIFTRQGLDRERAEFLAHTLVEANLTGHDSHGVTYYTAYSNRIKEGHIDVKADPKTVKETPASALVDGGWSPGQITAMYAMELAVKKAKENAVSAVGAYNCNHIGRVGYYTNWAAERDIIAMMFVNVGASTTMTVIARGSDAVFVKYIDVGGRQMDEAVAKHLKMSVDDAAALRRHNGDRRADQRDPEITRGITESIRPVLDRLANEVSMCVRYYSVTFRGQPLSPIIIGGGEATQTLVDWLTKRLDAACELGDPLRGYQKSNPSGRIGQWDIAAGLALRDVN